MILKWMVSICSQIDSLLLMNLQRENNILRTFDQSLYRKYHLKSSGLNYKNNVA